MPIQQPVVGTSRITITKDMVLREIMYHEFPLHRTVNGLDSLGLDEAPLNAYLNKDWNKSEPNPYALTDQQLEFLLSYKPPDGANDRLVVFITKTQGRGKLMGADLCNPPTNTQARSNASFAVFHCSRNADPVLVCFTEELCLASHHDMPFWFQKRGSKVDKAKILRICAVAPVRDEAWNVWHRIVTAKGVDVMPGAPDKMNNSLHGEINTQGCWMLFRNFNWPRSRYSEFEVAYRTLYRNRHIPGKLEEYQQALVALGYSVGGAYDQRNGQKALGWDQNHAYTRFVRHVVGVQYFSTNTYHCLYNSDGEHFHPMATQEYVDTVVRAPNAHDFQLALGGHLSGFAQSADVITAPHTLFDDSRLGFKRQARWAPTLTRDRVASVADCSWADLILFDRD